MRRVTAERGPAGAADEKKAVLELACEALKRKKDKGQVKYFYARQVKTVNQLLEGTGPPLDPKRPAEVHAVMLKWWKEKTKLVPEILKAGDYDAGAAFRFLKKQPAKQKKVAEALQKRRPAARQDGARTGAAKPDGRKQRAAAGERRAAAEAGAAPRPSAAPTGAAPSTSGDRAGPAGPPTRAPVQAADVPPKLKVTLVPKETATQKLLEEGGNNPWLELTMKNSKSMFSITKHLKTKWKLPEADYLLLSPPADCNAALRQLKWDGLDHQVTAADVFVCLGRPDPFRLAYSVATSRSMLREFSAGNRIDENASVLELGSSGQREAGGAAPPPADRGAGPAPSARPPALPTLSAMGPLPSMGGGVTQWLQGIAAMPGSGLNTSNIEAELNDTAQKAAEPLPSTFVSLLASPPRAGKGAAGAPPPVPGVLLGSNQSSDTFPSKARDLQKRLEGPSKSAVSLPQSLGELPAPPTDGLGGAFASPTKSMGLTLISEELKQYGATKGQGSSPMSKLLVSGSSGPRPDFPAVPAELECLSQGAAPPAPTRRKIVPVKVSDMVSTDLHRQHAQEQKKRALESRIAPQGDGGPPPKKPKRIRPTRLGGWPANFRFS